MAQALPQLFGVIPTNLPCLTNPTSAPSETSFLYTLPASRSFSHIVVFLLPGITLPPNTAAAVYISLPQTFPQNHIQNQIQIQAQPAFRFLGGIGPGKESAIFKISGFNGVGGGVGNGEVDMDAPDGGEGGGGEITLGISIESAESVSAQMALLSSTSTSSHPPSASNPVSSTLALTSRNGNGAGQGKTTTETVVLAQRIIKNAFNFLASFSGNVQTGMNGEKMEVVPLKAFEEWWRKFEGRVRNDPGFLERGGD